MKKLLKCAAIRAVKTFFQAFVGAIGSGALVLSDVNWVASLSAATLAAIISVAGSLATGLPEAEE